MNGIVHLCSLNVTASQFFGCCYLNMAITTTREVAFKDLPDSFIRGEEDESLQHFIRNMAHNLPMQHVYYGSYKIQLRMLQLVIKIFDHLRNKICGGGTTLDERQLVMVGPYL